LLGERAAAARPGSAASWPAVPGIRQKVGSADTRRGGGAARSGFGGVGTLALVKTNGALRRRVSRATRMAPAPNAIATTAVPARLDLQGALQQGIGAVRCRSTVIREVR